MRSPELRPVLIAGWILASAMGWLLWNGAIVQIATLFIPFWDAAIVAIAVIVTAVRPFPPYGTGKWWRLHRVLGSGACALAVVLTVNQPFTFMGIPSAAFQALVLPRTLVRAGWWIAAGIAGDVLSFLAGFVLTGGGLTATLVTAALHVLPQAAVLRSGLAARWWIPVAFAAHVLGVTSLAWTGSLMPADAFELSQALPFVASGVIYGAVTAPALLRLTGATLPSRASPASGQAC